MTRYKGYKSSSSGWFKEPTRHSLAAQGVPTGRKPNYALRSGYVLPKPQVAAAYGDTTVSVPPIPKELTEQEVMPDAESIVSSSEDRLVEDYESEPSLFDVGYDAPASDVKLSVPKSPFRQRTDDDVFALEVEGEFHGLIPQQPWFDRFKDKVKESYANLRQAVSDGDESGITEHLAKLNSHHAELQDKINAINGIKSDLQSAEYRHEAGVAEQLSQLKKVNMLLGEPSAELRKLDTMINRLEGSRSSMVRSRLMSPAERAVLSDARRAKSSLSIFPSFDEILHPEKVIGKRIDYNKNKIGDE